MSDVGQGPLVAELRGVHKSFGTDVVTRVLRGIDLALRPGDLAALVGPSGSGKSTLLNIVGLLDRPSSGEVRLDGRDVRAMDEEDLGRLRGRTIGFVFQYHHLLPAFTAEENVMMPLVIDRGRVEPGMRERARDMLERVGLADKAGVRANRLSGGQQQRVAVARALVLRPRLVLADEPTGNLDTEAASQVFDLLVALNREIGTAFLVVSHDPRVAGRCSRLVELVDGRIVRDVHAAGAVAS